MTTLTIDQQQVDVDFAEICRQERMSLVRYAQSLGGDWYDAEDAVQQAFLKVLETFDSRGQIKDPFALLATITRYELLSIRQRRRNCAAPYSGYLLNAMIVDRGGAEADSGVPCLADLADAAVAAVFEAALATLPPRRRRVVEMWCLEGCAWAQIAETLHTTEKAAQDLAYPALDAIRDRRTIVERGTPADHQAEFSALVQRAELMAQLTSTDQEILRLRYVEGLSLKAAAERLDVKQITARERGVRARRALRKLAEQEGGGAQS